MSGISRPAGEKTCRRPGSARTHYRNLRAKYGNLAVADPLVDLAELGEEGRIAKDSVVALWAPCIGVQLAALILRWVSPSQRKDHGY